MRLQAVKLCLRLCADELHCATHLVHSRHSPRSDEVLSAEREGPIGQKPNRIDGSLGPRRQLAVVIANTRHTP